jgi:hypothetical protein
LVFVARYSDLKDLAEPTKVDPLYRYHANGVVAGKVVFYHGRFGRFAQELGNAPHSL